MKRKREREYFNGKYGEKLNKFFFFKIWSYSAQLFEEVKILLIAPLLQNGF